MIYLKLFLTFLKIGAFTFGGGYAMLPLVEQEVYQNGWMSMEKLVDFVAVSESTPGPFAVNVSTYVGMQTGGVLGAFFATLGVILPSFVIILIIARFLSQFQGNHFVEGAMAGLKPAVVGLIAVTVCSVGVTVFFPNGFGLDDIEIKKTLFLAGILSVALALGHKKIHPIWIIGVSACLGIVGGFVGIL